MTTHDKPSDEKARDSALADAFDNFYLRKVGTNIIIAEPSPALVAFRTALNHPGNKDIADVAMTRTTFSGIMHTVAALLDYTVLGPATNQNVERILGQMAEMLRVRTALVINTSRRPH